MKKKKRYQFQQKRKKGHTLAIITIVIGALFSVSAITWIWWNGWDIERSYERIENSLTKDNAPEETAKPLVDDEATDEKNQDKERPEREPKDEEEEPGEQVSTEEAIRYIEGQKLPKDPTYVDGILIANKKNPLPSTFAPGESPDARTAFDKMAAAAVLEGIHLTAFSTYRSFEYQTGLYERYVERDGVEEADRYSARPGYSEHQTGLAFDIGEVNGEEHWASESFGETEAGKWIAKNAHHYGFIMRYPKGKEPVTGYMYEAWHFRYVGEAIAQDIYKNDQTLEEYLEL